MISAAAAVEANSYVNIITHTRATQLEGMATFGKPLNPNACGCINFRYVSG